MHQIRDQDGGSDGHEEREQASDALAKARERRRALDRARDEQDQRIEGATASVLIALEVRAEAERALESATSQVGEMLKALLFEDVSAERAAALLELDVAEVRRFVKAAPSDTSRSDAGADRKRQPEASGVRRRQTLRMPIAVLAEIDV